jgi:hypothetical protein
MFLSEVAQANLSKKEVKTQMRKRNRWFYCSKMDKKYRILSVC